MRRSAGEVVPWMEENSCGSGEVYAVVLFNESGDVLLGASPDGDVVFHVIGTVLQQAGEGVGVFKIFAPAEHVGCCSQRVGSIYAATSVSAERRLFTG
jgi:hypothetical protein